MNEDFEFDVMPCVLDAHDVSLLPHNNLAWLRRPLFITRMPFPYAGSDRGTAHGDGSQREEKQVYEPGVG